MIEQRRPHFSLAKRSHLLLFLLLPAVYLSGGAYAQSATVPAPPPSSMDSYRNHIDLSACVTTVILFCVVVLITIFSFYLNYWTTLFMADRNQTAGGGGDGDGVDWRCSCSPGVGREVLDTFPILVYSTIKDLKIGKGELECAVCLSEFKDYENLRLVPKCNHVFHPECIDAWLASHVTCPVCRANLKPDPGEVAIGVPTQLNANELGEESEDNYDSSEGEASETAQHPVVQVVDEVQSSMNTCECETDRTNMDEARGRQNQNRNRRSRWRMFGKLPRSNSTGHSLVEQPGKNSERYTLRLPDDVRRYILLNHATIGRSVSYHVMPMKWMVWSDSEGSSKGKRNYIER